MRFGKAAPAPRLAWCETVTAGPLAPNHLRLLEPGEDLRTGGGLFTPALCGRDLSGGWDLSIAEMPAVRHRHATQAPTARVCVACAEAALGESPAGD